MKDKLEKLHRKASYYRTRKVAVLALALMVVTAGVAVPLSLLSVDAENTSETSETTSSELPAESGYFINY